MDIIVRNTDSLGQLIVLSARARKWLEENARACCWQWVGNSLIVEWRFVGALVAGARAAGLEVKE